MQMPSPQAKVKREVQCQCGGTYEKQETCAKESQLPDVSARFIMVKYACEQCRHEIWDIYDIQEEIGIDR